MLKKVLCIVFLVFFAASLVNTGSSATIQGQRIVNGGFETGNFTGWRTGTVGGYMPTISRTPFRGSYSAKFKVGAYIEQTFSSPVSRPGDLTFWERTSDLGILRVTITYSDYTHATSTPDIVYPDVLSDWGLATVRVNHAKRVSKVRLECRVSTVGVYLDQVSMLTYYFADGFESGSFSKWSGVSKTYGETASVVYNSIRRTGYYSARFTSNGGRGYEKAYCYKTIPSDWTSLGLSLKADIYVRGYFYVSRSGIGDRFQFIILKAGASGVAFVGWRRNSTGAVNWCFNCKDEGSYPQPDHYSSYLNPHPGHWYCVELHWQLYDDWVAEEWDQSVEVWINGHWIGSTSGVAYEAINQVQFGLPQIYNCGPTTVYADNLRIQNTYIGP